MDELCELCNICKYCDNTVLIKSVSVTVQNGKNEKSREIIFTSNIIATYDITHGGNKYNCNWQ